MQLVKLGAVHQHCTADTTCRSGGLSPFVLFGMLSLALLLQTGCAVPFGKRHLSEFGNYRERQIEENIWEIEVDTTDARIEDVIDDVAVYRATEIGSASGHRNMILLNAKDITNDKQFQLGPRLPKNTKKVVIKVRYSNDAGAWPYLVPDCELPSTLDCQTISVEAKARYIGPRLKARGWQATLIP